MLPESTNYQKISPWGIMGPEVLINWGNSGAMGYYGDAPTGYHAQKALAKKIPLPLARVEARFGRSKGRIVGKNAGKRKVEKRRKRQQRR